MAEGARLESVYTFIAYRGFESLSLRQIQRTGFTPVFLCLKKWALAIINNAFKISRHPYPPTLDLLLTGLGISTT